MKIKKIMKNNIKKKYLLLFIIPVLLCIGFISNYLEDGIVLENSHTERFKNDKLISVMVETGVATGVYQESGISIFPTDGYIYNETLSKCENGSKLTWNEDTRSVTLKANISDKCYVYFDVEPPDVYIATSNIPTTVGAQASLNCDSGATSWNQQYNRIEVSQLNAKYTTCNLSFTARSSKTYFNDYIIGLSGTTQGTGQVVNENGYRYEGQNPNNYVWFNNELWRIIGVFGESSHGVSGTNLVKIIRANSIGGLAWDKSKTNDWTAASLMNLLNVAYYNQQDGTNGDYCYGSSTKAKAKCDYTNMGISSTYRSMIKNVTWYLGGLSDSSSDANYYQTTVDNYYAYERGDTVYSGRPTSTTGNIGLMYPSDYGYAALASSCARTTNLGSYNTAACTLANWLYGNGYEWTITPRSSSSSVVFFVGDSGNMNVANTIYGYSARPVLYLDSSVYVIDGSGTESDPYIIGM